MSILSNLTSHLNPIPILISTLAMYVLAGLWYGVLFKEKWYDYTGLEETEQPVKYEAIAYGAHFITTLFASSGLHVLFQLVQSYVQSFSPTLSISPFHIALTVAAVGWGTFIVPSGFMHVLFARKSLPLWLIDSLYWLTALLAGGVVVVFWNTSI